MKIIEDIIQQRAEQKVRTAACESKSAVRKLLSPFGALDDGERKVFEHLERKLDEVLCEIETAALPRFVRREQQDAAAKFQAFLSQ